MAEKLLEIKNLHVIYKTDEAVVRAVNGLNITVNKGETLGLVGETGAGKTTTCLSILRLLPDRVGEVTEGTIEYAGENLLTAPEERMREIRGSEISMIFQDPMSALNPVFTVGDQIGEVVKLHNPKFTNEEVINRVETMFKLVGLPAERRTEYPHQFSGGMKQRIVIAMALACEPLLLLADEPTTALDVTIQAQVLRLMKDLKDKLQTAMILVTHDLGVVAQACDKVAIMYAGEAIEAGTAADVFDGEEHHPYTVGLFGSIPDIDADTDRLTPIDGLMPDPANLPSGCAFNPRCPHCMDICRTEAPKAYVNGEHIIKCHLFANK